MKLIDIVNNLKLETKTPGISDIDIKSGYTSDLLSDVMAHAKEDSVLITIQAHKNSVAVASMIDLPAIFICNKRPIPEDMIKAAQDEEIGIYRTSDSQYELSWKLHQLLSDKSL